VYNDFTRMAVDSVEAGDICAFTGANNVSIGDTVCSREFVIPLPTITVCTSCDPFPLCFDLPSLFLHWVVVSKKVLLVAAAEI